MRNIVIALFMFLISTASAQAARLEILVFLSSQQMTVMVDGETIHRFDVSTARKGKVTPTGVFRPQFLSPNHRSSLYNNAPMPNSVFYSGNYAIHGTYDEHLLGRPASAGCVRLSVSNSRIVFELVEQYGFSQTEIRVVR